MAGPYWRDVVPGTCRVVSNPRNSTLNSDLFLPVANALRRPPASHWATTVRRLATATKIAA
jgi:hypothetical protein